MIKKMMALLAAISCAIGAWADVSGHLSGTDFSGLSAGPFVTGLDDSGQSSGTTYWFAGDPADIEGSTIVSNSPSEVYLDFESNIANPIYRTIINCKGADYPSEFNTTNIGTGLFIDTHVQFTPYLVNDSHLAPTNGAEDKLIVWVREIESVVENEPNITNLIVTAGYYGDGNALTPTNYEINLSSAVVSELCSHTNRLTIKAFESITGTSSAPAGFVVYLNETALEYTADAFDLSDSDNYGNHLAGAAVNYYETGHRKLFPSLVKTGANKGSLSCVGFAGMGRIDDVIFDSYYTDYPAFAGDPLTFTVVKGEGVYSYVYGDQTYTADQTFPAPSGASVIISNVEYTTGWKHKEGTWYNGTTIVSNEYDAETDTDYGTFVLANGNELHLVGFQANYLVGSDEYQTLFGGTVTEPEGAITVAARTGATFKLTKDTVVNESGNVNIVVDTGDVLVIDLNGHTLRGSTGDDETFTIVNIGGSLTVTDSSVGQTGAVLGSIFNEGSNQLAIQSISASVTNKLEAGTFEIVEGADIGDAPSNTGISGGKFLDLGHDENPDNFYLQGQLDDGFEVVSWDQVGGLWYATIGSSGPTPPSARFPQSDIGPSSPYYGRDGSAALPFVIRSHADLVLLQEAVAVGEITNQCFEQVADIDMDGKAAWPGIGAGEVIATGAGAFEGTYDGGNHVISNVTFASARYTGLFNSAVGAVIKNLTVDVDGIQTTASKYGAGAFVGTARDSFFTNLVATGAIGTSEAPCNHTTGGLFGRFEGCVAYACTNRVEIWCSKDKVGGIAAVGQSNAADTFELCSNEGNIHASWDGTGDGGVGGILGWQGYGYTSENQSASYINCRSIGLIDSSAVANKTGSFVGERRDGTLTLSGTNIAIDGMRVIGSHQDNVTYGKSIGGGLVELCTQAAFETNNTYSTMWSNLTPTFAFEAAGTISFNTNLFQATAFNITCPEGYDVEDSEAGGIVTFTCSNGGGDPWMTGVTDDASAAAAVEAYFDADVAAKINTLAKYESFVAYLEGKGIDDPAKLDTTYAAQKPYAYQSYILGADELFTDVPKVTVTDVAANATTAGKWDFTVKVSQGASATALAVDKDKLAALVLISGSLSPATWVAPTAGNISADGDDTTHLVTVTINYGEAASGFMKVSEE